MIYVYRMAANERRVWKLYYALAMEATKHFFLQAKPRFNAVLNV